MNGRRVIAFALGLLLSGSLLSQLALANNGNGNSVAASAQVANEGPANLRLVIQGDEDAGLPGVQLSPPAVGALLLQVTAYAEDGNGWQDLRQASLQVLRPDGSARTELLPMVAADGTGRQRTFTTAFEMSGADAPGVYTARLLVKDRNQAESAAEAAFEWRGLLAFALESTSVSFGESLGPGMSSHASPASVVVRNTGTVPIDLLVAATALTTPEGDASIPPDRVRYSPNADMSGERALSLAGVLDATFDLAPGQSRPAYLDLHVPTGDEMYVPAAFYRGAVTLGGVVG